ncbi:MAG TPA: DUF459 domain-containing protein [Gallionellaceae bacterium]|nr:DUF459 domain-containing protein [Gallionellaceae bacterium]
MHKPARKRLSGRDFYLLLLLVLSCNMALWLDSFDRYLSSRYHFYLSQYLPDYAYAPSRHVEHLLRLDDDAGEAASTPDADDNSSETGDAAGVVSAGPTAAAASAPTMARGPTIASAPPAVVGGGNVAASAVTAAAANAPGGAMPPHAVVIAASAPVQTVLAGTSAAASAPVQTLAASAPAAAGMPVQGALAAADAAPKILFAGDSMMQGVAPIVISRLRRAFPHGVFVDASKESTGLTVKRYFDWPTKIKDECTTQGLRTVVIFLGPNDPWDIYEHRKRYIFPSDTWQQKYRSRVDEVLAFATARRLRVIWMGLPVMRKDRIEEGAKIENRIFQEETRKYRFEYLPTGDIVGPVDQPYKKYIEDPKRGKIVVRADDGIHFTSKGLRMISSRLEELLTKQDSL